MRFSSLHLFSADEEAMAFFSLGEGNAANAARFLFPPDTDEERVQPRRPGRVEYGHGTRAGCNHLAVGKADPLAAVMAEKLVANRPVSGFVLAAVGVQLPGDVRRQLVGNAS